MLCFASEKQLDTKKEEKKERKREKKKENARFLAVWSQAWNVEVISTGVHTFSLIGNTLKSSVIEIDLVNQGHSCVKTKLHYKCNLCYLLDN